MDTRNSALVVGLYSLGAFLVVGVGLIYYALQRTPTPSALALPMANEGMPPVKSRPTILAAHPAAVVAGEGHSLRDMQAALNLTRDKLDRSTKALHQKNEECNVLRNELDHSFGLLVGLLNDDARSGGDTSEAGKLAKAYVDFELDRLKEAMERSQVLDQQRERQLAQLQAELMQANMELAMIEQEAAHELTVLVGEKKSLEDATRAVVAGCGSAAVPALIGLLSDERVEIRRWSAKVLGAIGAQAQDARLPLEELLSDPDDLARDHALEALLAIGEPQAK